MKSVLSLSALVCTLLAAGHAGAENWSQQLSSKKPDNAFKIIATRHAEGDVFHFSVTVGLKDNNFGLRNHKRVLRIFNGKEFVSSCELHPTGLDGERIYSFRVARKYLEKSTFTYTDWDVGNTAEFWFYLKDFAEAGLDLQCRADSVYGVCRCDFVTMGMLKLAPSSGTGG